MPIIFAQSIVFIPTTLLSFFPNNDFLSTVNHYISYGSIFYTIMEALLIIFFTYFYTAIAFNPQDVSDNMKKQGGFIPGIRPGKQTAEFIDNILTKITLPGSVFLANNCYLTGVCSLLRCIFKFRFILWRNKLTNYSWCSFRYFATD